MRFYPRLLDTEKKVLAIESKRKLLAFLRTNPQGMTMESYLCLTRILTDAGWQHDEGIWSKDQQRLSIFEASAVELDRQIAADKDRLLLQTVAGYRPESAGTANPIGRAQA
jgi:hypothetical protein